MLKQSDKITPIVGSAATMLIFPLGVLGARGLRVITAKWWWAHGQFEYQNRSLSRLLICAFRVVAVLQGFFGLGCIIAAFVLWVPHTIAEDKADRLFPPGVSYLSATGPISNLATEYVRRNARSYCSANAVFRSEPA